MKKLTNQVYSSVIAQLPFGVVLIDESRKIVEWNAWMQKETGIASAKACGQHVEFLFPNTDFSRFYLALEEALDNNHPQILSQVLNRYTFPIKLKTERFLDEETDGFMQQSVSMFPIDANRKKLALVVILDVTESCFQRQTLLRVAKKYEDESFHDSLTGLYNIRYLWEYLDTVFVQSIKEKKQVVCNMFDLDKFKSINDELGHDAGDEVLRSFALVIKECLRSSDESFRYGGEEFITISLVDKGKDITNLAERICKKMGDKKRHGSVQRTVTCSVGVSSTSYNKSISASFLIKHADQALYQAKSQGRNRVCKYSDAPGRATINKTYDLVDFESVRKLIGDDENLCKKFYLIFLE